MNNVNYFRFMSLPVHRYRAEIEGLEPAEVGAQVGRMLALFRAGGALVSVDKWLARIGTGRPGRRGRLEHHVGVCEAPSHVGPTLRRGQ